MKSIPTKLAMINVYIDPTETRENSKMPSIPGAVALPFLEALTGADFMITVLGMPASTENLCLKHVQSGALLVQRKHGSDLHNSVGSRMNESLARMRMTGASQSQCVLLAVEYGFSQDGVWWTEDERWNGLAAMSKWHDRGGVVEILDKAEDVPRWIDMKVKHLQEYLEHPVKVIYPDKPEITVLEGPLQLPQLINDGRVTLATLPGIGVKRADDLWKAFNGNLSAILIWLTDPHSEDSVKGIGKGTVKKVREWLGLEDYLTLVYEAFETKEEK